MTAQMDNYLQFPVEEDYDDGDEGDNSPSDDEEEEQEQGTANNNEQGTAGIMDRKRKLKLDDLPQTDDINVNVSGPIRSDDPVENADRVAAMQYAADFEARQPPSKLARMNNINSNNLVASTLGSAQTVIPSAQSQQQQALAQANTSIPFQPQTQRLNNNNPVARSSQIIQPAPEPEMKITKSTRWKPSKSQRDVLLQEFEMNPYPTVPHKGDIADRLGVKRAQVAKWFQHRRETLVRLGQFKGEKQRDRRTKEELDILERTFNVNPYPNGPECVELCQQLPGVTEAQIRLWFKHKRNALLKRAHQRGSSSKGTVRPANANASEAAANHQVDQAHGSSSRAAVAGGSSMTLPKNVPNSQVSALHKNIASGVSTLTASPMPASPRANKHEHSPPLGMMPMQQQQQQQQQQKSDMNRAMQRPLPMQQHMQMQQQKPQQQHQQLTPYQISQIQSAMVVNAVMDMDAVRNLSMHLQADETLVRNFVMNEQLKNNAVMANNRMGMVRTPSPGFNQQSMALPDGHARAQAQAQAQAVAIQQKQQCIRKAAVMKHQAMSAQQKTARTSQTMRPNMDPALIATPFTPELNAYGVGAASANLPPRASAVGVVNGTPNADAMLKAAAWYTSTAGRNPDMMSASFYEMNMPGMGAYHNDMLNPVIRNMGTPAYGDAEDEPYETGSPMVVRRPTSPVTPAMMQLEQLSQQSKHMMHPILAQKLAQSGNDDLFNKPKQQHPLSRSTMVPTVGSSRAVYNQGAVAMDGTLPPHVSGYGAQSILMAANQGGQGQGVQQSLQQQQLSSGQQHNGASAARAPSVFRNPSPGIAAPYGMAWNGGQESSPLMQFAQEQALDDAALGMNDNSVMFSDSRYVMNDGMMSQTFNNQPWGF